MSEQNSKLYVGNLVFSITEDELRELFEQQGVSVQSVSLITDKYTGRARGFGFVEVATAEDAQKAIDALNDQDIKGRKMVVNVARAKGEGGGSRGPRGGGSHSPRQW